MSDEEEEDQEYFIHPSREEVIRSDILEHLDILKEKTINFEDLLNELVRHGSLSFEEKFKILSGIVDENTSNKTLGEKCNELYQTLLVKKRISLSKLFQAWEFTGNSYLVGRFDTHFSLEGRDSKSLKYHKLKALPSHRTEFLTHLHLKQLTLSPKALLKCLRKSSRLVSIRLERIKVPYGGRSSDDPSSDFDQPLLLPNLKEFYFEEVSKSEAFKSVKEVNFFLDELNLKPMLFFGLNSNMAWDSGIRIEVRMRGALLLKMDPDGGEFISMLRRRPVEYGGFINPGNVSRISLYECYLPKMPFSSVSLSHLIIYRCKVPNFDALLSSCPNLEYVTLYGDAESNNVSQIDLNCFSACKPKLKTLCLGYTSLFFSNYWDKEMVLGLELKTLYLDTCNVKLDANDLSKIFSAIEKLVMISVGGNCLYNFASRFVGEISVSEFCWEQVGVGVDVEVEENNGKIKGDDVGQDDVGVESLVSTNDNHERMISLLSKELGRGKDASFILEKVDKGEDVEEGEMEGDKLENIWKVKKVKNIDPIKMCLELGRFNEFMQTDVGGESWFDLPFKIGESGGGESADTPRKGFRLNHGY